MNAEIYQALGLQANPFPPGACKDCYFQTEAAREILDEMQAGVVARKGFLALVGEVGLGKTSLLLQLLPRLEKLGVRTSWVFNTLLNKTELLAAIARDYGIAVPESPHLAELLDSLHGFVLKANKEGNNCAIIIDEAHLLDFQAMEVLRMLSNLEYGGEKLVQIVLAGQPELRQKLEQPELRQLRSRINLYRELPPLSASETGEYVNYKLSSCGSDLQLDGRALKLLRAASGGNCRRINLLMEKALQAMVARGEGSLSAAGLIEGLREVAAWDDDLNRMLRRMQLRRFGTMLATALLGGLVLAGVLMFWQPWDATQPPQQEVAAKDPAVSESLEPPVAKETATAAEPAGGTESAETPAAPEAAETPETTAPHATPAVPAPLEAAEAPLLVEDEAPAPTTPAAEPPAEPRPDSDLAKAARAFLAPWELEGALRSALYEAVRENRPEAFAAALQAASRPEQMPLQVVSLQDKPEQSRYKVSFFPWRRYSDFGPAWLAMWRPPVDMRRYALDYSSPDVVALQERLDLLGYYRMGIDGKIGPGTWKSVENFQREHGLDVTGVPDAETLFRLYHTTKKASPGSVVAPREKPREQEAGG